MKLRRLTVAVLAVAIPIVALAGPASAATYPPGVPAEQKTVAPGVVYGGDSTGVPVTSVCDGQTSLGVTVAEGAPFVLKVCGWVPGTGVTVTVKTPSGATAEVDTIPADGDGAVTTGPLRLTTPGAYSFTFRGVGGNVQGLGVGGVGSRGLSRVMADPNRTVTLSITVPAAGNLPHTGSSTGGPSTAVWGGVLLVLGALVLLGVRARRHRTPAPVEVKSQ